jgi:two-component system, sensor histidine kinase and response regulator
MSFEHVIDDFKEFKVLIVDDIAENIKVLGNTLKEEGLQILTAINGRQALAVASAKHPDLILLDIQMPEMDGYEVCKNLKANPNVEDIPIIFLTARTEMDDIIKGFELGAVDYITKPFNSSELLARVFTHLRLKNAYDIILRQNKEIAAETQKVFKLNEELNLTNLFLAKSREDLQLANSSKDKFFSIIAHDLINPLSVISGIAQVLIDRYDFMEVPDIKEILNSLNETSKHSLKLFENLLEWSRSQIGRIKCKTEEVDLSEITSYMIDLSRTAANNKNIQIINNIPDNTVVYVDRNMIETVVRNLISNAIKFTNPGGTISIGSKIIDKICEFSISDNGVGISEENQKKIFRIDENHSQEGTTGEKGTGLGLILCKEFVEKNGGKICVKSEIGKGSTFYFTLPNSI